MGEGVQKATDNYVCIYRPMHTELLTSYGDKVLIIFIIILIGLTPSSQSKYQGHPSQKAEMQSPQHQKEVVKTFLLKKLS